MVMKYSAPFSTQGGTPCGRVFLLGSIGKYWEVSGRWASQKDGRDRPPNRVVGTGWVGTDRRAVRTHGRRSGVGFASVRRARRSRPTGRNRLGRDRPPGCPHARSAQRSWLCIRAACSAIAPYLLRPTGRARAPNKLSNPRASAGGVAADSFQNVGKKSKKQLERNHKEG